MRYIKRLALLSPSLRRVYDERAVYAKEVERLTQQSAKYESENNALQQVLKEKSYAVDSLTQQIRKYETRYDKTRFPGMYSWVPYYTVGRIFLPEDYSHLAIVVPIDGEYVLSPPFSDSEQGSIPHFVRSFESMLEIFKNNLETYMDANIGEILDYDDGVSPYIPNPYFNETDGQILGGVIVDCKPRKYLEIGSGNSTRFARQAIKANALDCEIVCIDPNPRLDVDNIADRVIKKSFLDIPLREFESLQAGDILFLDGSHLVFDGTDTTRFFLEILPAVNVGVMIHLHDIFLPFPYPSRCDRLYWNEQYILAAFLMMNDSFETVLPVQYLFRKGYCGEGGGFWFRRKM